MADKKVNNKEIVIRQWFASRFGSDFAGDHAGWSLPKGIADLEREYTRDNPNMRVSFNFFMYKVREIEIEVRNTGTFRTYGEIAHTEYAPVDYSNPSNNASGSPLMPVAPPEPITLNISKIDNLEYGEFKDFPTDTIFDTICSDDDTLKGPMSGMVIICTGESGVGKSTLLLDVMAKIEKASQKRFEAGEIERQAKTLYVSTEMTKTDLFFFNKKTPAIGKVDTVIIADYLKRGLKEAVVMAFQSEAYDVILLDSYQDLVEKMSDILNWRSKEAENFLIQLMIEAAENLGKCVIAIQHLTKGGEYVGRTFLKHATTAMMQLKFDKSGSRYVMFSKNRRAGSMTHMPLYFTLRDGEVAFDTVKFETMMQSGEISKDAAERQEYIEKNFGDVFDLANRSLLTDVTEDTDDSEMNEMEDD